MTDQYVQGALFYTEEEVQAKITEASNSLYTYQQVQTHMSNRVKSMEASIQRAVLDTLRATQTVDKETAITLYNEIANACGWEEASVVTEYEVEVVYNGTIIGTFTVEAQDEDSAIREVQENMESEATMEVSISFNDETINESVDIEGYEMHDFSFQAWEA